METDTWTILVGMTIGTGLAISTCQRLRPHYAEVCQFALPINSEQGQYIIIKKNKIKQNGQLTMTSFNVIWSNNSFSIRWRKILENLKNFLFKIPRRTDFASKNFGTEWLLLDFYEPWYINHCKKNAFRIRIRI